MSNKSWFALSLMVLFMFGTIAVSSFGAIDISLTQLNAYQSDNHYGTAIRRGTSNVPILGITIVEEKKLAMLMESALYSTSFEEFKNILATTI